jgi:putative intracellular protease/amidase
VKKFVPYNLQQRLQERGMIYSKAFFPRGGHTVVDGNLITGQNPNSAKETAQKALEVLKNM